MAPSLLQLKFSVTQSAVRYFVLSETHQQVVFFGDYTLHHVNNMAELAVRFEQLVQKDEVLQLPFAKTLIGFDEKYSLVPADLAFMIKQAGQLSQKCGDAEIVFNKPVELMPVLTELFPTANLVHLNSSYFTLADEYGGSESEKLFVNVSRDHLDIVVFEPAGKLKLMNRYQYKAAPDFIYFLLLCCEELRIDRDKTELVLLGEVSAESRIYELCYRYFKEISFLKTTDTIHFSKAFDSFPKHLHFNLYNLHA